MCIQRNPDGTLTRVHPYAPTFILVLRNGRRIYHDAEAKIRLIMAANRKNIIGFYVVRAGHSVALPF